MVSFNRVYRMIARAIVEIVFKMVASNIILQGYMLFSILIFNKMV